MSLDAAWAVGVGVQFTTMGVPAVVTRPAPNDTPIETRLIWVNRSTPDVPDGSQATRRDPRRIAALKVADVPAAPKGTRIVAPDTQDGTDRTWRVDGTDRVDVDQVRVVLLLVTD